MKKDGSSPGRQGITNVFELNDLLNELWHTIPPGKGRKALAHTERVLHQRICDKQNPDCWLCQFRYWDEMETMLGLSNQRAPEESDEAQSQSFDIVRWLNDSINTHMRERKLGQKPSQSMEVLSAIHEEVARRKSHTVDCIFCVAEKMAECGLTLEPEQLDSLAGYRPMLFGRDSENADPN